MPARIPKPCRKTSCAGTTVGRDGYCDEHKGSSWAVWQEREGNTTQRGYGYKWQKLRKQILARDFYLCQTCLDNGTVREGSHVDHMTSKAQGGTDAPDNLQTLCVTCHAHKTATERTGGPVKS